MPQRIGFSPWFKGEPTATSAIVVVFFLDTSMEARVFQVWNRTPGSNPRIGLLQGRPARGDAAGERLAE